MSGKERTKRCRDKKRIERYGNLDDHRGCHGNHAASADHGKWNAEGRTFERGYVKVRVGENIHSPMTGSMPMNI